MNQQIHLVSPQGIFTPKILDMPLSITTAPKGPYDDSFNTEGFLLYKYRGTDPHHIDNVRLRRAMEKAILEKKIEKLEKLALKRDHN